MLGRTQWFLSLIWSVLGIAMVRGTPQREHGGELRFRPQPFTDYTGGSFALQLTDQNGDSISIPAFYRQPVQLIDGGDRQHGVYRDQDHLAIRWRPQTAGRYAARIIRTEGSQRQVFPLPFIEVTGDEWDDYWRVDSTDSRFFVQGSRLQDPQFVWPMGVNIRSLSDERAGLRLGTAPTLYRGSLTYGDYFSRFASAGINHVEIWLAAWNLALEWRPDYPHFGPIGAYNQFNAERIDAVLASAWRHGIRLTVVLNNHGQTAARNDAEWKDHPHNIINGGFCEHPEQYYTNPQSLAAQADLRRYIIARYADHPALFQWKLSTEIDLTDLGYRTRHNRMANIALEQWHQQAAAQIAQWDLYDHPITTHWSSDYRMVDPRIARISDIDTISIDAYHF